MQRERRARGRDLGEGGVVEEARALAPPRRASERPPGCRKSRAATGTAGSARREGEVGWSAGDSSRGKEKSWHPSSRGDRGGVSMGRGEREGRARDDVSRRTMVATFTSLGSAGSSSSSRSTCSMLTRLLTFSALTAFAVRCDPSPWLALAPRALTRRDGSSSSRAVSDFLRFAGAIEARSGGTSRVGV